MDGSIPSRFLMLIGCLAAGIASGCATGSTPTSWWPLQQQVEERIPGVIPPHERIAGLRQSARQAPRATPEQQQRAVAELSSAISNEKDSLVRAEIIRTLGEYRTPEAVPVLKRALSDTDADVRVMACEAWGKRGDAEAAKVLAGALAGDSDSDVRLAAARALGRIKDPAAVAALGEALTDKDPAMQYRAVQSLRESTGKDFGNDVQRWQQYVRGELPAPSRSSSFAERLRQMF